MPALLVDIAVLDDDRKPPRLVDDVDDADGVDDSDDVMVEEPLGDVEDAGVVELGADDLDVAPDDVDSRVAADVASFVALHPSLGPELVALMQADSAAAASAATGAPAQAIRKGSFICERYHRDALFRHVGRALANAESVSALAPARATFGKRAMLGLPRWASRLCLREC
ncbi:MAG: hypothetical protein FWD17_04130 [Polyangiaceae bacterium]|nr:hypothetical protein [Polyangiaceae bacterium]